MYDTSESAKAAVLYAKPPWNSLAARGLALALLLLMTAQTTAISSEEHGSSEEHESEPGYAVLFPAFTLTLGVIVFYMHTRYVQVIPYTAIMFLLGTLMGIGASLNEKADDILNESIRMWTHINPEVLLWVFLPGLIFKDAIGLNVHLFRVAIWQCIIYAFPMVLAGTALTALVGTYIFPFGWSFNLSMTFGAILSATDPVAVSALLEQVGAPPRLKVHIAGEALLNDGAAIVFFEIFALRYLYDLGLGVGEDIDGKRGAAIFFQKSLGGVAVGLFFGLGLLFILNRLDRRFNREENVVEVTATLAIAYIGYFVAEPVWETSGVIATLACGITVKFLGRAVINDAKLLDDFWSLLEALLNTVLFTLGGVVWGEVIAQGVTSRKGYFTGKDWGYLILLYVLLHVIRFILFACAYPITSRIGLKSCIQETLFQVYGGLRGAVGIALALALDNGVKSLPESENQAEQDIVNAASYETKKLFGYVGGFAFMTLLINGSTAGPLLRRMGLSDSTETRLKIVSAYQIRFRSWTIDRFVQLLTQKRFSRVNFALVKHHVPILADLTMAQLKEAVEKNQETTLHEEYEPPCLKRILPYLKEEPEAPDVFMVSGSKTTTEDTITSLLDVDAHARKVRHDLRTKRRKKRRSQSSIHLMMEDKEPLSVQELRTLFISILKAAYERQITEGELEDRQFLTVTLQQSLEFAADAVSNGDPLHDWDFVNLVDGPITTLSKSAKKHPCANRCVNVAWTKRTQQDLKYTVKKLKIERSLAFMSAHRWAQKFFRREFENADSELSEAGKRVMNESETQWNKAQAVLKQCDPKDVEVVSSHKFCMILLNSGVYYVGKLLRAGLLKDDEAEELIEDIEHHMDHVKHCDSLEHPGEIEIEEEDEEIGQKSATIMEEDEETGRESEDVQ